ncbi:MAG: hypothetical protein ACPGJV_13300 [Bacteriovoracaceae bacterium]
MPFSQRTIIFLSLVLFAIAPEGQYQKSSPSFLFDEKLYNLYFLGIKTKLHIWERKYFSLLNIFHLMTPSGLHLTSVMLPIHWFARKALKKDHVRDILFIIFYGFLYLHLDGFFALKRVALFGAIYKILAYQSFFQKTLLRAFGLTFLVDFLFGSYFESPLSFCYSFFFWGIILSRVTQKKPKLLLNLILSQLLMTTLFQIQFSFMGAFLGQMLTMIFPLIFSLSLFLLPLHSFFELSIAHQLLKTFHQFAYVLGKFSSQTLLFIPCPTLLLFFMIPSKVTFLICLLIYSPLTLNQKKSYFKKENPKVNLHLLKQSEIQKTDLNKGTFHIKLYNDTYCHSRLKNTYYSLRCRY